MLSTPVIDGKPEYSLIIPVYRNEASIADLLKTISWLSSTLEKSLEVVFVVDGSPDRSFALLSHLLAEQPFQSRLVLLSRNFGAFAAIREGLVCASGRYFAVMAADLQEPIELIGEFFRQLSTDEIDVTLGVRLSRQDPFFSRLASRLFWGVYRRFVQPELPPGGVDVFGCNMAFRDALIKLEEANSSLVGQILWLGFRRREVPYHRQARQEGKSAWTLKKKLRYLSNSIYSFTDLPIRLLSLVGGAGVIISLVMALSVLIARLAGWIQVPGYTVTLITVLFFAALNMLGLGIVGAYVWRAYENTKHRPQTLILHEKTFAGIKK